MSRRSHAQVTIPRRFDVALTVDIEATEDVFILYFMDYIDDSGRCLDFSVRVPDAAAVLDEIVGQDKEALAATVAQLIGLAG